MAKYGEKLRRNREQEQKNVQSSNKREKWKPTAIKSIECSVQRFFHCLEVFVHFSFRISTYYWICVCVQRDIEKKSRPSKRCNSNAMKLYFEANEKRREAQLFKAVENKKASAAPRVWRTKNGYYIAMKVSANARHIRTKKLLAIWFAYNKELIFFRVCFFCVNPSNQKMQKLCWSQLHVRIRILW